MTIEARGVAVVSGGGSGIGREMALELSRRGYPLALLGRRAEPLAATLKAAGGDGLALVCDVRDPASIQDAAEAIHARWTAASIVVPAAGTARVAPLEELSPDDFSETIDTNLTGAALLIRAFLPAMKRQGEGWIVPVLSTAARQGFPGWSAYCASKWGLAGLVTALREELRGSGVRVTALYPGATDTDIWNVVPGEWNRAAMVPSREVARALAFALDAPSSTLVEEIHLGPAGGAL